MLPNFFKQYFLPGLVFQSVIVAGGYGTGQELLHFFLQLGPIKGLMGLCVSVISWSIVCACCYEFARKFRAYDYKSFFKVLLGDKKWYLFEISYMLVVTLVLSVIAASAGSIGKELLGMPYYLGVICILSYITYMVFHDNAKIEKMFSIWSILLYIVFAILFILCISKFSVAIKNNLQSNYFVTPQNNWINSGIKYASYNLGLLPAVFFTLRHQQTRKQSIIAGLLTGPIAMLPGIMFYISMLSFYPKVLSTLVPSTFLLEKINIPFFTIIFGCILIGTLMETGVGLIHALNQRIASHYADNKKQMPKKTRAYVAIFALVFSLLLSQFGLIELIAKGYGFLVWVILAIFILPLFTIGIYKICFKEDIPLQARSYN